MTRCPSGNYDTSDDTSVCTNKASSSVLLVMSWELQLNDEKCCVIRFAREKSAIERLDIAQFGSYYVRGVGLPFVDSCKELGKLVDMELKFYSEVVGKR